MARSKESLTRALDRIPRIEEAFWRDLRVTGSGEELNQELERAGRVADFFELAELLCYDALQRNESAGGHFRVEHQTPDGEAKRNDDEYAYVAAWEWKGAGRTPALHREPLAFERVPLQQRSYK
jgi:succinate dehydrogenase / fumarate reductase flavoprotein subunit